MIALLSNAPTGTTTVDDTAVVVFSAGLAGTILTHMAVSSVLTSNFDLSFDGGTTWLRIIKVANGITVLEGLSFRQADTLLVRRPAGGANVTIFVGMY